MEVGQNDTFMNEASRILHVSILYFLLPALGLQATSGTASLNSALLRYTCCQVNPAMRWNGPSSCDIEKYLPYSTLLVKYLYLR